MKSFSEQIEKLKAIHSFNADISKKILISMKTFLNNIENVTKIEEFGKLTDYLGLILHEND